MDDMTENPFCHFMIRLYDIVADSDDDMIR